MVGCLSSNHEYMEIPPVRWLFRRFSWYAASFVLAPHLAKCFVSGGRGGAVRRGEGGGGRPGSEMMSSVSQGKGERLSVIRDGGIFGGCCVCVK